MTIQNEEVKQQQPGLNKALDETRNEVALTVTMSAADCFWKVNVQ